MTTIQILLWGLVALPFLLLLLVLAAIGYGQYSFQKTIKFAANSLCPKCGAVIGKAAILAGRGGFSKKVAAMMKERPGVKFRIVAEWEMDCPQCGMKFYFYSAERKFETTSRFAKTA